MAADNPLKATFFAFQKRERGGVLMQLSIGFILISLLMTGVYLFIFRDAVAGILGLYGSLISAAAEGRSPDTSDFNFTPNMFGALAALIPVSFVYFMVLAAFETGVHRWLIRGEVKGPLGFAWDGDTWRVWGVYWIWLGVRIILGIVIGVIGFALVGVFGSGDVTAASGVQALWEVIGNLVTMFIAIRFGPAAATTVLRQEFSFSEAWTVTRGRFWALFGAFFLLVIIFGLIYAVLFGVAWAAVFGASASEIINAVAGGDPEAVLQTLAGALQTPTAIAALIAVGVVYWIVSVWSYIAFWGVNARAAVAAVEDGKIDAVLPQTAAAFD